jgi:hypothetical protein
VPPTEEVTVPVVLVHEGITQGQYEDVVRRLTGGKTRLESVEDWPVSGLLVHAAGQSTNGFRVVDVWESEEAVRRFGDTLMPLLAEVGVEQQPEVYPAHTFVSA